jgi:hypothetical protein
VTLKNTLQEQVNFEGLRKLTPSSDRRSMISEKHKLNVYLQGGIATLQ